MNVVFLAAMANEAEAVTRCFSRVSEERAFGRRIVRGTFRGMPAALVEFGVGKVNAAAGTQLALERLGADMLVNAGVAGGLDPAMRVAEVYTVSRAVQWDFDLSAVNPAPRGSPNEYDTPFFELAPVPGYPEAICASGDVFSNDDGCVRMLRRDFGARLRDMELGAIAHVAKRAGVRLCAIKALTDVHDGNSPVSDQYAVNLARGIEALAGAVSRMEFPV